MTNKKTKSNPLGSGRHKKSCECPKCIARQQKQLKELKEKFKEPEAPKTPEIKAPEEIIDKSEPTPPKTEIMPIEAANTSEAPKIEPENTETFESVDLFTSFRDYKEETEHEKSLNIDTEEAEQPEAKKEKRQIKGTIFILIMDLLCPPLLKFIMSKLFKKDIDMKKFRLEPDEKADLLEIAEEITLTMGENITPEKMLFFTALTIYGMKIYENYED